MPRTNVVKDDTFHYKWSKKHPPVLNIKPGDRVHFEVNEVSSWQMTENSKVEDLAKVDNEKLYPLAGPVYVEGAETGRCSNCERGNSAACILGVDGVYFLDWGCLKSSRIQNCTSGTCDVEPTTLLL